VGAGGRGRARLWKRAITREGQSRVGLDARAADCYDIIVRRGGGAGLVVDEADERRRSRAFATVAVDGKLANWVGRSTRGAGARKRDG
jgi:hypothetical protein